MRKLLMVVMIAVLTVGMISCASMTKATKGAAVGTAAGGVAGAVIGNQVGNTALGAIIGAAVGGAAGAYIGNKMDQQAAEIEKELADAQVERVGEGIKVTLKSGLLLTPASRCSNPPPRPIWFSWPQP